MTGPRGQWLALALFIGLCLTIGAAGSVITRASLETWYATLRKPEWTPPDWVFGPVWTFLYIAMGVAAWLVWRRLDAPGGNMPLVLFGIQLALNLGWSAIFFGMRAPGAALAEIGILWIAVLATLIVFWRVHPIAGLLFVPYILWVSYAAALNYRIWRLNPGA